MTIPKSGRNTGVEIIESHDNTSQETIRITSDRLKLILIENLQLIESNRTWPVPLSFLLAIILVFCSADFKDFFYLTAASWTAVFLIGGVASVLWFLRCLFRLSKSPTIDDIIALTKNKTSASEPGSLDHRP